MESLRKEKDKIIYKEVIDGVINAQSSTDLKKLIDTVKLRKWYDPGREMFLYGLLQGALFQYKKDVSIQELKEIFYNV